MTALQLTLTSPNLCARCGRSPWWHTRQWGISQQQTTYDAIVCADGGPSPNITEPAQYEPIHAISGTQLTIPTSS